MTAFEIYINGKRRCLAGIDIGVLTAVLSSLKRDQAQRGLPKKRINLSVGGLNSLLGEHIEWLQKDLAVGDEVLIRILDTPKADASVKNRRKPKVENTRNQKAYVRRMAKKFGWKIIPK